MAIFDVLGAISLKMYAMLKPFLTKSVSFGVFLPIWLLFGYFRIVLAPFCLTCVYPGGMHQVSAE